MTLEIEGRLHAHSAYFESLFALVPAQYQSVREEEEEAGAGKATRFWHNKRGRETLQAKVKRRKREESVEATPGVSGSERTGLGVEQKRSISLSELQKRLREKTAGSEKGSNGKEQKRKRQKQPVPDNKNKMEEKKKQRERAMKEREARQKRVAVAVSQDTTESNDLHFSFSRFDFSGVTTEPESKKTKKNYKALLAKAEAKEKKLQEMVAEDEEKGGALEEKKRWCKAVKMARGEKVKDDPSLLRKTMKRLEKKKQSNTRKWKERVRGEQERREAREKRRKQNIKERVNLIKAKKTQKRAKKKGFV